MLKVKLIGKKGSKACRTIAEESLTKRFLKNSTADFIVNYGLSNNKVQLFYEKFPRARKIPIINRYIDRSKYSVVNLVSKHGILAPESKVALSKTDKVEDFIEKRTHSIGGLGIKRATKKAPIVSKYYQRFVSDRAYELRVHAFRWIPSINWHVFKRFGNADTIAWNFKQGGHFSRVHEPQKYKVFRKAIEISEEVLKILDMGFGAVDFIVGKDNKLYFLEVNSAPGFEGLSKGIYIDAFNTIQKTSINILEKIACK